MSPVPRPVPALLRHLAKSRTFLLIIDPIGLCHFIVVCDLAGDGYAEIFLTLGILNNFTMHSSVAPVFSFLTETPSINSIIESIRAMRHIGVILS